MENIIIIEYNLYLYNVYNRMAHEFNKTAVYVYTGCNKGMISTGENRGYIELYGGDKHNVKLYIPGRNQTFHLIAGNRNTLINGSIELKTDSKGGEYVKVYRAGEMGKSRDCVLDIYPCKDDVNTSKTNKTVVVCRAMTARDIYDKLIRYGVAKSRTNEDRVKDIEQILERAKQKQLDELPDISGFTIPKGGKRKVNKSNKHKKTTTSISTKERRNKLKTTRKVKHNKPNKTLRNKKRNHKISNKKKNKNKTK